MDFLHSWAVGTGFTQILRQIVSVRVKTLSHTNLVASRHMKNEKVSLLVDVRRSKTLLLIKLSTNMCIKRSEDWFRFLFFF